MVPIFFWYSFSFKLLWLQRITNKIITILYNRYHLQNFKAIEFEKIASHTKYKKSNVPSHLHIFSMNFDKANRSFIHPFLLFGKTDFQKNAVWRE